MVTATAAAWALGPEVTIAQAAENHSQLLAALPALAAYPRLELSAVTDFDSSGVQLLLALRSSLAEKGQTLHLVSPSAAVLDALGTFGLREQFPAVEGTTPH
ncbi:MAG: STAS domain-containing protein [Rubrivivax sp.]|nr:STAS domain-containing protein [Rubrivivax sp.]